MPINLSLILQYYHPFKAEEYRRTSRAIRAIGRDCIKKRIQLIESGEQVPNDILTHILQVASTYVALWVHNSSRMVMHINMDCTLFSNKSECGYWRAGWWLCHILYCWSRNNIELAHFCSCAYAPPPKYLGEVIFILTVLYIHQIHVSYLFIHAGYSQK